MFSLTVAAQDIHFLRLMEQLSLPLGSTLNAILYGMDSSLWGKLKHLFGFPMMHQSFRAMRFLRGNG